MRRSPRYSASPVGRAAKGTSHKALSGDNTQVGEDFHDESQTAETHGDFSPVQQEQDAGDAQQHNDPAELAQS